MTKHISSLVVGLLVISVGSVGLTIHHFHRNPMPSGQFAAVDPASFGEACFTPLRDSLKGVPQAGYMASRPIVDMKDMGIFFLAQYFLAPTLLVLDQNQPVLIVNFDQEAELETLLARQEYETVTHSRPGLAVLKKRGRP